MRLPFGLSLSLTKAVVPTSLQAPDSRHGWWRIWETRPGDWQRNIEPVNPANALTYSPVYACVTLIANDVGKLRLKLIEEVLSDIWEEFDNPAYSPVLRKPNHFQTRIEFFKSWMFSRLLNGNTYVLKVRDNRRVVIALYVLDPTRVKVLVAPNGEVFYELNVDHLSQNTQSVTVPASDIIHDKHDALWHPLVGISPLSACYLAILQALRIQNSSENFFANGANPGGVLTSPGFIRDETALRLKEYWDTNFTGDNAGKVAVLGDGLKYEAMRMTAVDSQLVEQLKLTAEDICTAFHVPPYKIGVGPYPPYNNIEALNTEYYSQALQSPIESIELLIDEGLALPLGIGVEFDLDQLLRMDTQTRMNVAKEAVGSANFSVNESRKRFFGMRPVTGGNVPFLQEQNWPISQLSDRELPTRPPTPPATPQLPAGDEDDDMDAKAFMDEFRKALAA